MNRLFAVSVFLAFGAPALLNSASAQTPAGPSTPIRIAVYADEGASRSKGVLIAALESSEDFRVERLSARDIRDGKLAGYRILIQPGGSGGGQGRHLGEEGRQRIREFVRAGGGYVGICAGAYLATCDYPWSLRILDAKVIDKAHWARGNGEVELSLSSEGKNLFGISTERRSIVYWQGPLLAPAADPDVPDYQPLATYATEIAEKGAPKGVMIGTTAIASGMFGEGRVLCFSPHPEKSPENHSVLFKGLQWVAGKAR